MQSKTSVTPIVIAGIAIFVAVVEMVLIVFAGTTYLRNNVFSGGRGHRDRGDRTQSASVEEPPEVDGTVEGYYSQKIMWRPCEVEDITGPYTDAPKNIDEYECARVRTPLDWDKPEGESITLAIAVHRTGREAAPALFFNLGGPGGAAVSSLASQVTDSMGEALVDAYDIVALDPRGVGASTPVVCMSDEERDEHNAGLDDDDVDLDTLTPAERVKKADEDSKELAEGCREHSGEVFKHIDTVSVAKDFDMVRQLLGQEKLHYLGYSYGTFLGATYADLFPDKVGRFVLDGAVDPALDANEISALQMRGFEDSIGNWAQDCLSTKKCPFSGDVTSVKKQLKEFLDRLEKRPLKTADPTRPLTQDLALTAVIGAMYSTDTYPVLTDALVSAVRGDDGSQLLFIADVLNERNEDGTYESSASDALVAVNMLDYEAKGTVEEWAAEAEKLKKELPVFGDYAGWASAGIDAWPTSHAARKPVQAKGAPPIVVVGTTHDPATPYVMAQGLASQLPQGVLVTWEGWDHCAYSKDGSACVARAVEGYLVDGEVPTKDLRCED